MYMRSSLQSTAPASTRQRRPCFINSHGRLRAGPVTTYYALLAPPPFLVVDHGPLSNTPFLLSQRPAPPRPASLK